MPATRMSPRQSVELDTLGLTSNCSWRHYGDPCPRQARSWSWSCSPMFTSKSCRGPCTTIADPSFHLAGPGMEMLEPTVRPRLPLEKETGAIRIRVLNLAAERSAPFRGILCRILAAFGSMPSPTRASPRTEPRRYGASMKWSLPTPSHRGDIPGACSWSWGDSNPRPSDCQSDALPTAPQPRLSNVNTRILRPRNEELICPADISRLTVAAGRNTPTAFVYRNIGNRNHVAVFRLSAQNSKAIGVSTVEAPGAD